MDKKIWFTSDTHFGHIKDFLWSPRGFNSIEEHDEIIIKNWNELVAPEDEVYHLGDVMLNDNEHGFAGQTALVVQVAAENHHAAHADGQGEEGLVHGRTDGIEDACLLHALKVRRKIEGEAFPCPVHGQGADGQAHHDDEQAEHHVLDHGLKALAHAKGTDAEAQHQHKSRPGRHAHGILQHVAKEELHSFRRQGCQFP